MVIGAGLLLVAAVAQGPTRCQAPASALPEASGAVVSDRQAGIVFSHDDSGDSARFVALDLSCHVRGSYRLALPMPTDWEDAALGPGHTLVFGDIGDNDAVRTSVRLVTVPEPTVGQPYSATPAVRVLRYDDGAHDAEGLLVQPATGQVWVVTKSYTGVAGVYAATGGTLRRVATVRLGPLEPVTGASVRRDGRAVMLRTYDRAFEWAVPDGSTDLGAALAGKAVHDLVLPGSPQGEGVSYTGDGRSIVLTSEARGAATWPLDVVPLPWEQPVAVPSTGPATTTVRIPDRGPPAWWFLTPAGVGVALAGLAGWLLRRSRSTGKAPTTPP